MINGRDNPMAGFHAGGAGMLEILIALLILSIGVLGMSQLQGVATRQNYDGYLRSQATFLAFSIADRMRANQEHAASYRLDMRTKTETTAEKIEQVNNSGRPEQVKADLKTWLDNLDMLLPSADGAIDGPDNNVYTITVAYDIAEQYDDGDNNDDATDTVTVSVQTEIDR